MGHPLSTGLSTQKWEFTTKNVEPTNTAGFLYLPRGVSKNGGQNGFNQQHGRCVTWT